MAKIPYFHPNEYSNQYEFDAEAAEQELLRAQEEQETAARLGKVIIKRVEGSDVAEYRTE